MKLEPLRSYSAQNCLINFQREKSILRLTLRILILLWQTSSSNLTCSKDIININQVIGMLRWLTWSWIININNPKTFWKIPPKMFINWNLTQTTKLKDSQISFWRENCSNKRSILRMKKAQTNTPPTGLFRPKTRSLPHFLRLVFPAKNRPISKS